MKPDIALKGDVNHQEALRRFSERISSIGKVTPEMQKIADRMEKLPRPQWGDPSSERKATIIVAAVAGVAAMGIAAIAWLNDKQRNSSALTSWANRAADSSSSRTR